MATHTAAFPTSNCKLSPEEEHRFDHPRQEAQDMPPSVLVIGAGMSGLACARELAASGLRTTVLEARDRVGGRIHTVQWEGTRVDVGASWIHGIEGNPLSELVHKFNVATVNCDVSNPQVYHQGAKVGPNELIMGQSSYDRLKDRLHRLGRSLNEDVSVLAGVKTVVEKEMGEGWLCQPVCETLMWLNTSCDYACSPNVLSLKGWHMDTDLPGGDAVFPGGYCELVDPLTKGLDVKLGHVVEAVRWNSNKVQVSVAGTEMDFEADAVVVTVPLGVLQSGKIDFDPCLPLWKNRAIEKLYAGSFNKVVLRFPLVFWGEEDSLVFTERLSSAGFLSIVSLYKLLNVPILVGLISGDLAASSESMSDDELMRLMLCKLGEAFGSKIPEPLAVYRTKWGQDPFAMGSFSSIPVGATIQDRENLRRDVAGKLYWAGEATSAEFCATVHGAYLSGIQAAKALIRKVRIK